MSVRVLFFGALSDTFGSERMVDLREEGTSLVALRDRISANAEEAATLSNAKVKIAIDQRLAAWEDPVRDGQEVAFFSPVSGG